ncbi:MAG: amidohydrolase family protein [bacterium]
MERCLCVKRCRKRVGTVVGVIWIFCILTISAFALSGTEDVIAIKAGRIVTVTGGVIEKGTIIIRDGIIEAVGKDVAIPAGAEVIEEDTMYVYPGLIDAHSSLALEKPKQEEQPSTGGGRSSRTPSGPMPTMLSPEKLAADMLNPKDASIKKVRESGITTVLTVPEEGVFVGQSALINLNGDKPGEMILKSPVAMHIGYSLQRGTYPSTLMAVIAFQRQTFFDAQHHKLQWDRYKKQQRGIKRPVPNPSLDALAPVMDGRQKVVITANSENEMKRALKLADEFGLDYILSGTVEGWRIADVLGARMKPILVSVEFPKPESVTGYSFKLKVEGPTQEKAETKPEAEAGEKDKAKAGAKEEKKEDKNKEEKNKKEKNKEDEEKAELYANAGVLYQSGVKFAFTSAGLKKPEDFLKNVAKTVEHGLPKEEALKALTINPAEIFGVADQVGSIEEGKIANLIVTTGELFDEKTRVKYVFVDGKKSEVEAPKPKKAEGEATVNVSGTWDVDVTSPMGEVSVTISLKQSGSEVTGEFKSEMGSYSIYDGSVNGNKIQFSVKLPIGEQPVELVFTGTVEGDSMEGTIDLGEMGSAEWKGTKTSGPGF